MPINPIVEISQLMFDLNQTEFARLSETQQQETVVRTKQALYNMLRNMPSAEAQKLRPYVQLLIAGLMRQLSQAAGQELTPLQFPATVQRVFGDAIEANDLVDNLQRIILMGTRSFAHNASVDDQRAIDYVLRSAFIASRQLVPVLDVQPMMQKLQVMLGKSLGDVAGMMPAMLPLNLGPYQLASSPLVAPLRILGGGGCCCNSFQSKHHRATVENADEHTPLLPVSSPAPVEQSAITCSAFILRALNLSVTWIGSGIMAGLFFIVWFNIVFLYLRVNSCDQIQAYQNSGSGAAAMPCETLYDRVGSWVLAFHNYDRSSGERSVSGGSIAWTVSLGVFFLIFAVICLWHTLKQCLRRQPSSGSTI